MTIQHILTLIETGEQWKPIIGYEKFYAISNFGNVYSLRSEKMLSLCPNSRGYYLVNLHDGNGLKTRKGAMVHRLVAEHFITKIDHKECVNHIDGVRTNNHITNLEWCNHSENMANAVLRKSCINNGRNNPNRILDVEKVKQIRASNKTPMELAIQFGVSRGNIYNVLTRKNWKHV